MSHTAVSSEVRNGWEVVAVSGEIDIHAGPTLRDHLLRSLAGGERDIVVDLSGVPFLDSSGLGVLVEAHKRARLAGCLLRLASCQPTVATIFQITALDRAFSLHLTVEDAIAAPRDDAPLAPSSGHGSQPGGTEPT